MQFSRNTLVFATLVLALSCGKNESEKKPAKSAAPADLPKSIVMVVPVDEKGKEKPEKAELRHVDGDVKGKNQQQILSMFTSGKQVPLPKLLSGLNDDLGESSTNSWFWKRRRCQRNCGGGHFQDYAPVCQPPRQQHSQQYERHERYEYHEVFQSSGCGQHCAPPPPPPCAPPQNCGPAYVPTYRIGYQGGQQDGFLSPYIGPDGQYPNIYAWQQEPF